MTKTIKTLVGALALSLILTGCGKPEATPVSIADGIDTCNVCNMLVPDDQFATEIILKNGKTLKFDDLGCQFAWMKENGKEDIVAQYVRDYSSKEWVKLENATFAFDKQFQTPMAYGIFSFKDEATAKAFIEKEGRGQMLTVKDLESHTWKRTQGMFEDMEGIK